MDHRPLIDIGVRALEIIREPEHWTTKVYARDAGGMECSPGDPDASRWCALGAIQRAARELYGPCEEMCESADSLTAFLASIIDQEFPDAFSESVANCNDDSETSEEIVANFNDDEGHAAVVALFASVLECMGASARGAHVI